MTAQLLYSERLKVMNHLFRSLRPYAHKLHKKPRPVYYTGRPGYRSTRKVPNEYAYLFQQRKDGFHWTNGSLRVKFQPETANVVHWELYD